MEQNRKEEKPNILVTRASLPPLEEYEAFLREIWESRWLTNMGQFHETLKKELCAFLSVGGLELFVNGHTALEMTLQAFSLSGEVITTPFTFASTTHAIVRNGLQPVFCDVRADDATIDADQIRKCITKKTTAIVPVHVYGNLCDDEAIEEIAQEYGLKVIYDAAHAFGEERVTKLADGSLRRIPAAALGDASMLSFHATKVFNTIEGGAVCWNKPESAFLADRLYKLKNFGITGKESVEYVGGNGKMNEFAAAMGLCNLRHIGEWIKKREAVSARYRDNLKDVPGVRILTQQRNTVYNYAYLPVVLEGGQIVRDTVYEKLCAAGFFPRKYFYPCVNAYECYRDRFDAAKTPVAKLLSESVLTLPLYPELPLETVDEICARLEDAMPRQKA